MKNPHALPRTPRTPWWRRALCSLLAAATLVPPASLLACWEYDHTDEVSRYWDGQCWVITYDDVYTNPNNYGMWIDEWTDYDCPPPEDPPDDVAPCEDCPEACEGPNAFNVFRGDARRNIVELAVRGAASRDFKWARFHSTSMLHSVHFLGSAGEWRHSWQYDLLEKPADGGARPELELLLPTGHARIFRPNATGWAPLSAYKESIAAVGDGYEITTGSGAKLRFVRVGGKLQMQSLTDAHGLITRLDYDAQGTLAKVTDPAGHFLALAYRDVPLQRRLFGQLGTLEKPGAGWQQVDVPASLQSTAYRFVQIRQTDHVAGAIAEVEFFAPGSDVPLRGKPIGSSDANAAFDGNTSTVVAGRAQEINWWGLDLGDAGASRVARVRVLAKPGHEAALQGLLLEGFGLKSGNERVIATVASSNQESVRYSYETQTDAVFGIQYAALTRAEYGDGTAATYSYESLRPGGRPLLVEADDPLYRGRATRVRYAYHREKAVDYGFIHQEINPATGGVYASLELDSSNPDKRIVHYSDLRSVVLTTPKSSNGRPTERIDSLGRKTRWEYADGGRGRVVATIDAHGRRTEHAYTARGDLAQKTDAKGRVEQLARDAQGRLQRHVTALGLEMAFTRDARGRATKVTSSDGRNLDFTYDDVGRVTSVRTPAGFTRFEYDARGLRTQRIDANGAVTRFAYDAHDRLIAVTDALGNVTRSERDGRGQVTKIIRPDGSTLQFAFDKYGHAIAKTDEQGRTTRLTYDDLGRVIRKENFRGEVTTFDYTELPQGCASCTLVERPSRIVGFDGRVIRQLHDSEGRVLAVTVAADTPDEATTTYTYDEDDNLLSVTDPLGRVTRHTYDDERHHLTATDPLGRVTTWTYDLRGNMLTTTTPEAGTTELTYDAASRVTSRREANGAVTRYDYDAAGNLVTETDPAGHKTHHTYYGKLRTATLHPDGKRETWEHDLLGRVSKAVSADGLETSTVFDGWGRPLKVTRTAPGGAPVTTTFAYDAQGRQTSLTDALGRTTKWTYDAVGNLLATTRADGLSSQNTYDTHGRRTAITDEQGNTTRFTYDAAGDMVAITDARGNTYRSTFDAQHRRTAMIYPDNSKETWRYDLAGQVVSYTTRAGQTRTSSYNAIGRPLAETWNPEGAAPSVNYTYNPAGQLVTLDNGQAKLSYTYDELGRVASEKTDLAALVPGLRAHTVSYVYDELGRRAGVVYPSGTTVSYRHDSRNRVVAVEQPAGQAAAAHAARPLAEYSYDAFGLLESVTRENGLTSRYAYDAAAQVTDITHARANAVLAASHYSLDALGRRTSQSREDGATDRYDYDAIGQLTGVDYGAGSVRRETFAYDAVGNRTEVTKVSAGADRAIATYSADASNHYLRVGDAALQYDANGSLIADGQQSYRYDAQNRLVAVENATTAVELFYDARSRCVMRKYYTKDAQGGRTLNQADSRALTYDPTWNLLAERRLDGTPAGEYIHGAGRDEILRAEIPTPAQPAGEKFYPAVDGVGSTILLANASGAAAATYRYDAFGNVRAATAGVERMDYRHLFTGRERLAGVGLNDHRNRYYAADLGRWLTNDPLRFDAGDVNLRRYAANSLVNYQDNDGLVCGGCQPGSTASNQVRAKEANNCGSQTVTMTGSMTFTGQITVGYAGTSIQVSLSETINWSVPPHKKLVFYIRARCRCSGTFWGTWGDCTTETYQLEEPCP